MAAVQGSPPRNVSRLSPEVEATDPCVAEPVHTPGSIQAHATLLCVEPDGLVVVASAANLHAVLPYAPEGPVPRSLSEYLPVAICNALKNAVDERALATQGLTLPLPAALVPPLGGEVFAVLHDGVLYCEVESHPLAIPQGSSTPLDFTQSLVARIHKVATLEELVAVVANGIREATGLERILVYQFDDYGHGEVLGESLAEEFQESFLGFRFPASDIPPQARALYAISPFRYTADIDLPAVPLRPAIHPRTGMPFDLSRCRCRAISPMHVLYQRNLGVNGSVSVSILVEGRLWGLIVGHHRQPWPIALDVRRLVMTVADAFAMRLNAVASLEERVAKAYHARLHTKLLEQIAGADDFTTPLIEGDVKLTDIFNSASGAAVLYDDGSGTLAEVRTVGRAPPKEAVVRLAEHVRDKLIDGVFSTDCLSADFPEFTAYAEDASGVLAITVGDQGRHMILWFREEVVRTAVWGGASPAEVVRQKREGNYLPRASFERWTEEQRGHSQPWARWKLDIARSLRTALNDVILRQMRTIRLLNTHLVESDKAKSRFLAHMSHELRTPLNAILGYNEAFSLGIYGLPIGRQNEALGAINQAAQHLLTLINDILDLAKVESGNADFTMAEVDVVATIEQAVELTGSLPFEAGVSVQLAPVEGRPTVTADRRALLQMLINLLSNAVKFTPRGGRVNVAAELHDDGKLAIHVADTGVGIPADMLSKVMEPFRQAETNIEITSKGTGLGLPLIKALIEAHGGQVHLASVLGQGTTVSLLFPPRRVVEPRSK